MQLRRGNKINTESLFIPTEDFVKELKDRAEIMSDKKVSLDYDVYLATDDHAIKDDIRKK